MALKTKTTRILMVILLSAVASVFAVQAINKQPESTRTATQTVIGPPKKKGELKNFTGEQFQKLYESIAYPNSSFIAEESSITGNVAADKQMRQLAEKRGYKIRSAPVTDNFVTVEPKMLLQPLAAHDWLELKKEAKQYGLQLSLTAAYRSANDQKKIFLDRLGNVSLKAIAKGEADVKINDILETTALPGYSRHHTGYTIDIACSSDLSVMFKRSTCFKWLSADNYKHGKQHGWIPSYPDGTGSQGPEPEEWEYVWVGLDAVTN